MHNQPFYSVDDVARQLGLHSRTVRNYVRSGRVKAVRIGKQYRIARKDLEALTGQSATPTATLETSGHAEASAIVQIESIGFEGASRITNALIVATTGPREGAPLRVDTVYDRERWRLKVILTGEIDATASLLRFIATHLKNQ